MYLQLSNKAWQLTVFFVPFSKKNLTEGSESLGDVDLGVRHSANLVYPVVLTFKGLEIVILSESFRSAVAQW